MKYVALVAISLFVGSTSFAKKTQDLDNKTKKEYHNPLTGNDVVKETEHQKVKTAHGEAEAKVKKTTTTNSKGKKTEEVKIEADSESNPAE